MVDRRLDERFAIGARDQYAGADRQIDRPERTATGDIRNRLLRHAPREQRGEGGGFRIVEVREQHRLARQAERVRHQ